MWQNHPVLPQAERLPAVQLLLFVSLTTGTLSMSTEARISAGARQL